MIEQPWQKQQNLQAKRLHQSLAFLGGIFLASAIASCDTATTNEYQATAQTTYTWQVKYSTNPSSDKMPRFEEFASTSLLNQNGIESEEAVTGPDDKGLWWPALPPRPTVDEIEERTKASEIPSSPELIKSVEYNVTYQQGNQTRSLPTNYDVYRQVVKAYPDRTPLEFVLGINEASVEKAIPQ